MVLHPDTLIGRQRETEIIRDRIRRRKGLHLYGPEGSGKSALLHHILAQWEHIPNPPVPIYCRDSGTMREILISTSKVLLERFKHLKGADKYHEPFEIRTTTDVEKTNIINLRNILFHYLKKGDFCVILDHLENVTPRINSLLTALYRCAAVITTSRQSWGLMDYGFSGRLAYDLWLVPKLKVENLRKEDAFRLMESLYGALNMEVFDKRSLFKGIYEVSQGNPKMIRTIFAKAKEPKYLHEGRLNLNLVVIDCRMDEVRMS
jgi:hypothetical protein